MEHDSTLIKPSRGSNIQLWLKPALILIVFFGIAQSVRVAWKELSSTHARSQLQIEKLKSELDRAPQSKKILLLEEIEIIEKGQFAFSNIHWGLIAAAVPVTMFAIIPAAIFWWITLRRFGYRLPFIFTQSAYANGSLGKYVPGKAMVLILRAGALRHKNVPIPTTIVTIFVETLTSLAVAGAIGAITVSFLNPPQWLLWTALLTSAVTIIPTLPPLFQQVIRLLTKLKHIRLSIPLTNALTWGNMLTGWLLFAIGWIAMGISLWIISESVRSTPLLKNIQNSLSSAASTFDLQTSPRFNRSITNKADIADSTTKRMSQAVTESVAESEVAKLNSDKSTSQRSVTSFYLCIACIAATSISFVAGFLSMLPGGAGVRELVVTILLAPSLGYAPALAVAVLFRLVNLTSELLVAVFFKALLGRSDTPEPLTASVRSDGV